jgi:hypothetical protein
MKETTMPDTTDEFDAPDDDQDVVDLDAPAGEGDTSDVASEGSDSGSEPDTGDSPDDTGLSRRDVRYREKLRTAEAERDTLRQNLEAMQRREVERLASEHLTKPAALWTVGVELPALLGEDGTVDPDAVCTAALDARQQLGLEDPRARLRRGPVVPREGTTVQSGGKSGSWSDAFKR